MKWKPVWTFPCVCVLHWATEPYRTRQEKGSVTADGRFGGAGEQDIMRKSNDELLVGNLRSNHERHFVRIKYVGNTARLIWPRVVQGT